MKISKGEKVTEKAPRHAAKSTFDKNEGGAGRTKKKTTGHVETLVSALHGKDPYCASHKN